MVEKEDGGGAVQVTKREREGGREGGRERAAVQEQLGGERV